MSMKKILMAAVAVSAIGAGSATALTIDGNSSYVGFNTPIYQTATSYEPFTIANELQVTTGTLVPAVVSASLSSPLAANTSYIVTYTVTGGTFDTPVGADLRANAPTAAIAAVVGPPAVAAVPAYTGVQNAAGVSYAAGASLVTSSLGPVNSTTAPTSISFIVPTGANATIDGLSLKARIKPSSAKSDVSVSVGVTYFTSPTISVDGGATAPVTIIDFRDGLKFKTIPAANRADVQFSNASGFKKFSSATGDVLAATIGSGLLFEAGTGTLPGDKVYKDFSTSAASNQLLPADITSATMTIGGDLSVQKAILGASQGPDSAALPGIFTANQANLALLLGSTGTAVTLVTAGTATGVESAYTVTPALTLPGGFVPLTYSARALGSAVYEGTSVFAPWVGDGSNGISYAIRLGNKSSSAAVTSVSAFLLNPTTVVAAGGTVLQTASCPLGTIAAKGELVISSSDLAKCFGAFKRSDVKFVIQGTTSITAKMRSTSPNGTQTEASLGSGVAEFIASK